MGDCPNLNDADAPPALRYRSVVKINHHRRFILNNVCRLNQQLANRHSKMLHQGIETNQRLIAADLLIFVNVCQFAVSTHFCQLPVSSTCPSSAGQYPTAKLYCTLSH